MQFASTIPTALLCIPGQQRVQLLVLLNLPVSDLVQQSDDEVFSHGQALQSPAPTPRSGCDWCFLWAEDCVVMD